ncbi:MAG: tRNA-guanine transglycosylase, partial [Candidatus Poribacteria bacterium]|nr:tRNA-guanine transglycosylase [Candidatus Poribacteria bacterium]
MNSNPTFQTTNQSKTSTLGISKGCLEVGRIGELHLQRHGEAIPPLSTPILYPVVSFITGTTPRGGGLWKYILRDFMKNDVAMLSQVLHFLDFPVNGKYLAKWRSKTVREWYREINGPYEAPLMLDSGGFKLLHDTGLDLSEFGICAETEADDILALQNDMGGDIIASLDYPLPPGLVRAEAERRMNRSLNNACHVAERIANRRNPPFLYICCHGQSQADIRDYVRKIFDRLLGILPSFGLAVGSLVPLRGKKKDPEVLERILGVLKGIPDSERDRTPIHVFGVSGELTPILAYMGIDSFDSTSYIQTARGLTYSHPETRRKQKIMEVDETSCTCRICRKVPLDEMHLALSEEARYRRTSTGKYKSEYYAAIALHNFEMEIKLLSRMKQAIESGDSLEELVRHAQVARGVNRAVHWLLENDEKFASKMTKTVFKVPDSRSKTSTPIENTSYPLKHFAGSILAEGDGARAIPISLDYTPESFSIPEDYAPPDDKNILLAIPCAGKKPYSLSRTLTIVFSKLQTAFGEAGGSI